MALVGVVMFLAFAATDGAEMTGSLDEDAEDLTMHPRMSFYQTRADLSASSSEKDPRHWHEIARMQLQSALRVKPIVTRAKGTIMFLGDGMSIPTVTAARIYNGQLSGEGGEESSIIFDEFPYVGLSKTYSINSQVSDSASTATAYLGGVKTNSGMLGLTAAVTRGDCIASLNESTHVHSIIKWAQDAGMSTGIVTTTRVTHASPAGGYAHVAERGWENDATVAGDGQDPKVCRDIAHQLVFGETGSNLNVVMGGGRRNFLPQATIDEEWKRGKRLDGKNLIKEWLSQKSKRGLRSSYVWDRKGLMAVGTGSTDYLLGLFETSHLKYNLETDPNTEPTLAEMTAVAIKILSKNPKGYFLFVEGGRIDHGHHDSKAHLALDETVQLAEAVRVASSATSEEDTLLVVTADHAHTMSISGYAPRGNSVFDIAGISRADGLPYTTLSYANGPGYRNPKFKRDDVHKDDSDSARKSWLDGLPSLTASNAKGFKCQRIDISKEDLENIHYLFPSTVPLSSETHGGDDVAVYAKGPWAHIFSGSYEQNYIMHAMCYAMGIGPASGWSQDKRR